LTAAVDPRGALGARLGHAFRDHDLLLEALTHRSFANENPGRPDNERLALLGDAILALVVAERLLASAPAEPVGVLTPRRAALVSGENLARWAQGLGLGEHLPRQVERDGPGLRIDALRTDMETQARLKTLAHDLAQQGDRTVGRRAELG